MVSAGIVLAISACVVALVIMAGKGRVHREILAGFRAIVISNPDGSIRFRGSEAAIHAQHAVWQGGDLEASDGRLQMKFLCKDPSGCGFQVVVQGKDSAGTAREPTVIPLRETEFQHLLNRYPYKRR